MIFRPKSSGEQFAHQMVLEGRPFSQESILQIEKSTLQTLTELSQATPEQRREFEEVACHEITRWSLGRSLGLTGVHQAKFFESYGEPDCNNSQSRQEMVLHLLYYRFAKSSPVGIFRGPELERMRLLYLTGKESEPKTSLYIWDARIPDFRSGAARGLPFVLVPLILEVPIVGVLFSRFGIDSGVRTIQGSEVKLQNAKTERDKNEAIREDQRGKITVALSIVGLVAGFLRIFKVAPKATSVQEAESVPGKVLAFDPAARTTPLSPPPANPGEDIIDLAAIRAALKSPTGQAGTSGGFPTISPRGPGGALSPSVGQTAVNPPIRTVGTPVGNSPAAANMAVGAQPAAEEAAQVGSYRFEGTAALAKAKPVETLPVRPLLTPGQLNDAPTSTPLNPLALVDRETGNHVSHASVLNDLLEGALRLARPALSILAVMMSTEDPPGKAGDPSQTKDLDSEIPNETKALVVREKGDLVQVVGREIKSLSRIAAKYLRHLPLLVIEASFYVLYYPLQLLVHPIGGTIVELGKVIDKIFDTIREGAPFQRLTKFDFLSPTILLEVACFNLKFSGQARELLVRFKMGISDPEDYDRMIHLLERYNQRFPYFYRYLDRSIGFIDLLSRELTEDVRIKWNILMEVLEQFEPEIAESARGVYSPAVRDSQLSAYSDAIIFALLKVYAKAKKTPPQNKINLFLYLLRHKNDFPIFVLGDFIKKDLGKVLPVFENSSGNVEQIGDMLLLIVKYRYVEGVDRLKSMMAQIAEWNRARMPLSMQIPAFSQMFGGETRRF